MQISCFWCERAFRCFWDRAAGRAEVPSVRRVMHRAGKARIACGVWVIYG